jgi:hypothetical protein
MTDAKYQYLIKADWQPTADTPMMFLAPDWLRAALGDSPSSFPRRLFDVDAAWQIQVEYDCKRVREFKS